MTQHQWVSGRSVRGLLMLAGGVLAASAATPASAINEARARLGVNAWANNGYTGSGVVIANVDGAQPNPDHVTLAGKIGIQLAWPFAERTGFPATDPRSLVVGGRLWESTHATAVSSALVGNGGTTARIFGMIPDATLITSSFATGLDINGNYTNVGPTSLTFALFAVTDQTLANRVADALGIERYQVATVVNLSSNVTIGASLATRYGEDAAARILNAVVGNTGATIVVPVGDNGLGDTEDPMSMEDVGNILGPSGAYNVIAVGRLNESYGDRDDRSSFGAIPGTEWGVAGRLFDPTSIPPDAEPPPPSEPLIFETRTGPHILAPGTNLTLASSLVEPFESPSDTAFSDFWTGTSFASAIVAGAAALVHQAGNELNLWARGRPSNLVTKAVLINSASKAQFANRAMPDDDDVIVTVLGLDPERGGGKLDLYRLYRQFVLATVKDYTNIPGRILDDEGNYNRLGFGTDPDVPFVTTFVPPALTQAGEHRVRPMELATGVEVLELSMAPSQIRDDRNPGLGDTGRPGPFGTPGYVPPEPGPPRPGPGGGGDGGGGTGDDPAETGIYTAGWDHGNIGFGSIDIPIGFVNQGSRIVATLVWDRTERWALPNLAGPLHFIDPSLVVPAQFQTARSRAASPQARPGSEGFHAGWINHTVEAAPAGRSGALGTACSSGAAHPVVRNPDGSLMDGAAADRLVDELREQALAKPLQVVGQREATARGGVTPGGGQGLDIQFALSDSVLANPDFVAALNQAAAFWENLISDDVVVTMAVDFTFSQASFIAAASSASYGDTYANIRARLIDDSSPGEIALTASLPAGSISFETQGGAVDSDVFGSMRLTTAQAKALGYSIIGNGDNAPPPTARGIGGGGNLDAAIVFNTRFTFDSNRDDGIQPGAVDVVYVMVHELGHALGFISGVDGGFPTALDFFRMGVAGAANDPNTLGDFQSRAREWRAGVEAALDTVDGVDGVGGAPFVVPPTQNWPWQFSTGVAGGDGRQASHWKDDALLGLSSVIGVMDPTYTTEQLAPSIVTQADLVALSLIGWDIDFGEVPGAGPDPDIPAIIFNPIGGEDGFLVNVADIGREMEFENLNLELYRNAPGQGNVLMAASRSEYGNIESISVRGGFGPNEIISGNYTLRIVWAGVRYDFGGYFVSGFPSDAQEGYRDLPDARVEYALAWYVDQAPPQGTPIGGGGTAVLVEGDVNNDGAVDTADLAVLLGRWGTSGPEGDLNFDNRVDASDLAIVLGNFGRRAD